MAIVHKCMSARYQPKVIIHQRRWLFLGTFLPKHSFNKHSLNLQMYLSGPIKHVKVKGTLWRINWQQGEAKEGVNQSKWDKCKHNNAKCVFSQWRVCGKKLPWSSVITASILNHIEWWVSSVWLKMNYFVSLFKPLLTASPMSVVNNCLFYPSKCPKPNFQKNCNGRFSLFRNFNLKRAPMRHPSCHVFRWDRAARLVCHRKKTNELWQTREETL